MLSAGKTALSAAVTKAFIRSVAINSTTVNTGHHVQVKDWKEIPGPSSLPIIGQTLHFLPGGSLSDPVTMADTLFKTFGPIIKLDSVFGSPTLIFILDAEASAQVLRGENWMPNRPGFATLEHHRKMKIKDTSEEFTGLITDHGEPWKKFRTTVNPIMLQSKTIKLYSNILDEVADDMIDRMKSKRNEKNMIDGKFDVEMNLWALESIAVVALGGRINCLDPNLPDDSPAKKLIKTVHDIFTMADKLDFKPSLWRFIATPNYKKAMKCYEEQANLSKYFINKAMENYKTKEKSDDEKGILEKLLEIDEKMAVIMASDMLFAGVDTAANTMIATFYLLAKNPEKQKKLREEVLSQSERKPYLKACIKESMRIMPVVAGNIRCTSKEYNLLGYKIPKNMYVTFGHQYLSVTEQHFPRAKEFIPERWLTDKSDPLYYGNAHPFAYNPFGFGVRSCIGRRIAELELETFLSKVVQNFEIEWTGPPIKLRPAALNYIVGPFGFIFKDVKIHLMCFLLCRLCILQPQTISFTIEFLFLCHYYFRYIASTSNQEIKSWKEIPGPVSVPFLGQIHNYLPGGLYQKFTGYKLHEELYRRYGPISKVDGIFGCPPMIYVFDADGAAQVLRGENDTPIRQTLQSLVYYRHVYSRKKKNRSNPVTGLFSDQGDVWKKFRSAMNPVFLYPKVIQSYSTILDDVALDMIKRLKSLRNENNTIQSNFNYEVNLWSLESIAAVALGDRINCLDRNMGPDSRVNKLVKNVENFFSLANEIDFLPNLSMMFPTRKYNRLMQTYDEIDNICNTYINESIEKLRRNELAYKERGFLEKILAIDKDYAQVIIADMLFGGIDTGSNTLLATMYLLAKNPNKQNKLREEIISKSGKTYLKACLKEAMRIMPVANGNSRTTTKEYTILGYRIPKDMNLSFGHQLLCSLEEHYPQAADYIPERWLVDKTDPLCYGNAHPFTFSPFGFGVRSCIGRRIIELELEVFLSRLVENFLIGWNGPSPNIKYRFVNSMVAPYYFTFKDV
ncbi:uncharacterized protein LOC119833390 [Zerene cesonia]|uniref:uncharacterized protein LOC119833390 n=1 Tax=Zerene cesonia TaxID=33412 RepID=UPI0018E4E80B|nr:uncharacterized protein LOC119833390 [Zerene cesonia]